MKTRKFEKINFFVIVSLAFLSACSWNKIDTNTTTAWKCGDELYDERENKFYKTIWIDINGGNDLSKPGQCWMAENLNYGQMVEGNEGFFGSPGTKFCFMNSKENCDISGAIYTKTMLEGNVCPSGWHLPSIYEWWQLIQSLGGINVDTIVDANWGNTTISKKIDGLNISNFNYDNDGKTIGQFNSLCLPRDSTNSCPGCWRLANCIGLNFWTSTTMGQNTFTVRTSPDRNANWLQWAVANANFSGNCVRCVKN